MENRDCQICKRGFRLSALRRSAQRPNHASLQLFWSCCQTI
jgi:hypothetical protein